MKNYIEIRSHMLCIADFFGMFHPRILWINYLPDSEKADKQSSISLVCLQIWSCNNMAFVLAKGYHFYDYYFNQYVGESAINTCPGT